VKQSTKFPSSEAIAYRLEITTRLTLQNIPYDEYTEAANYLDNLKTNTQERKKNLKKTEITKKKRKKRKGMKSLINLEIEKYANRMFH
jgi:hypothetical protein